MFKLYFDFRYSYEQYKQAYHIKPLQIYGEIDTANNTPSYRII